jgi:excisionase family DNA binding protein
MSDAVKYLNLSDKKIRNLVKEGRLRVSQPEKKLLFHKTWLDAYMMEMGTRLTPTQKRELEELS